MSLTCDYSSPRSDGDANSQVTGARVQVPLGHEPFGHDAMLPVSRLTRPRRADLNKLPDPGVVGGSAGACELRHAY